MKKQKHKKIKKNHNKKKKKKRGHRKDTEQTNQHGGFPMASNDTSMAVSSSPEVLPKEFTLDQVTWLLCERIPCLLDLHDENLSLAFLDGMRKTDMQDIVSWFLRKEGLDSTEKQLWGPPKWNYTLGNAFDSFDYYAVTGCPNCGSSYDMDSLQCLQQNPPALTCFVCGHRPCQIHRRGESESFIERLKQSLEETRHCSTQGDDILVCFVLITQLDSDEFNVESSFSTTSTTLTDSAIYVRGLREQYNFGQKGKKWWQSRYLPAQARDQSFNRYVSMVSMMSALKAPTIQEICEICSNSTAYYTTFQARSADEGMTIMYECTRCHHRKTFNN